MIRSQHPHLDPDVAALEQKLDAAALLPFFPAVADSSELTSEWAVEARRRGHEARERFYPPSYDDSLAEDFNIPGPAGSIPVRVQRPARAGSVGILHFHGGGWVVGDLHSHRGEAQQIALACNATVVQVDYRLAPEHPFPAAIDDAIAALEWAVAEGERRFGVTRWALVGGSAGGNIAAVVAAVARDRGIDLVAQLLMYPATDFTVAPIAGPPAAYLGAEGTDQASPLASPGLGNVDGLCPTVISVGEIDFLLGDSLNYSAALARAGVEVDLKVFPGLPHGFFGYGEVSAACSRAIASTLESFARLIREATMSSR